MKNLKLGIIACLGLTLATAPFFPALADRMESDSFVIQFGNFNISAGERDSTSYHLTDTVGQTAAGPFGDYGTSNYFVGSGFQYIYQIDAFRFTISDLSLDLGLLTPGLHNTASNDLTISTRGAGGYKVYVFEQRPLTHSRGTDIIPDTSCDTGTCNETTAQPWVNQQVPGFGFTIAGDDIAADFINTNYFRRFADKSQGEAMQVIMSSPTIVRDHQATVTYKAGPQGSAAAGHYETSIVFVAVPGY